jgi:hypothetical protein
MFDTVPVPHSALVGRTGFWVDGSGSLISTGNDFVAQALRTDYPDGSSWSEPGLEMIKEVLPAVD